MDNKDTQILSKRSSAPVRRHMLMAGFVLLLTIILDRELLSFYLAFGVIGALIIVILASYTSVSNKTVIFVDGIISAVMFILFEYFAIAAYNNADTLVDTVFILRQIIALLFLGALYITLRLTKQNKMVEEINKTL